MSEPTSPGSPVQVPRALVQGVPMTKVTHRKVKNLIFRFDEAEQCIEWPSKRVGKVMLDQIREVRYGPQARPAVDELPQALATSNNWISIIYIRWPSSWKTLNVVARSDDIFKLWVDTIASLLGSIKSISHEKGCIGILGALETIPFTRPAAWSLDSAIDEKSTVSLSDISKMCAKIGLPSAPGSLVVESFRALDTAKKGHLTFEEFRQFVARLRRRSEVSAIYQALTKDGPLDKAKFADFLLTVQKTRLEPNAVDQLCESLNLCSQQDDHPTISYEAFATYLSSPDNAILAIKNRKVHQDMTRPLPEYFISSSHNTYLLGHQWKGESTVEGYIRALLSGCRSVELDCWNGDEGPVIYHGKTLTSSVSVRDVCTAVKRYGFMASPYPIIISAEVHCSLEQQVQLVKTLKEVFGDALITRASPLINSKDALPSPTQLMHKILFKSKRPIEESKTPISDSLVDLTLTSSTESNESDLEREGSGPRSPRRLFDRVSSKVSSIVNDSTSQTSSDRISSGRGPPKRAMSVDSSTSSVGTSNKQRIRVAPEVIDLLVYTAGVKYRGFSKLVEYMPADIFSVSEKTANKILQTSPADLIKHNRTHLSRVYPQGTRLTSTNFEPQRYWAMGCQLVALNWQTCDTGFLINSAMFARNGRCGYVLKPELLTAKTKEADWEARPYKLSVNIISGQYLPLLPEISLADMRLYVEITLHMPTPSIFMQEDAKSPGSNSKPSSPTITRRFRTKSANGNTFNPLWDEELALSFGFSPSLLELAFLEVQLKHETTLADDVCVAQWSGSLAVMEQGYRYIPLHDAQMSQYLFSTLFVRFTIE